MTKDAEFHYEDSLWLGEGIEIALYHTSDKRFAAAPWCAMWVIRSRVQLKIYAVTRDRALLRLLKEVDLRARNEHLGADASRGEAST